MSVSINNKIEASELIEYRVIPKNTLTSGSWDINSHLPQNIYTGYPQSALFTNIFYWAAQKSS
jgi:hypothetical protein